MPAIAKVARERGAIVIEDGCHGTGGGFTVDGKNYKIGGHPWADMTTFSFHPVKTMTTGEGGMLVTDNAEYAKKARLLRSHGITRESDQFTGLATDSIAQTEQGPWYYEMQALGYNFRITDFQCALGRSQLKQLPAVIERRREIVAAYNQAFADLSSISVPKLCRPDDRDHISWHLYTLQIDFAIMQQTRTQAMQKLRDKSIGTQVLYIPVYLQPWYQRTYGYTSGKCANAEHFYSQALSLPLYPTMSDSDVDRVINAIRSIATEV
jgi:dTDP-4-amino-4,6-dideoxygalactose transaminase